MLTNEGAAAFKYNKRNGNNLCPQEYQLCLCNYTSNNIEHSSDYMSLMIDCSKIQATHREATVDNMKKQAFAVVPKVSNAGANRNHLQQITQLDLSRTSISEIPTDAFHVNFFLFIQIKIDSYFFIEQLCDTKGLTGLKTIVITHCQLLIRIKMFAFRNLPNLKTLLITNNPNLVELEPHAFGSLKNLNYLALSMNSLSVIDGFIFSSSSSIKIISFIGNPIKVNFVAFFFQISFIYEKIFSPGLLVIVLV